MVMTLMEGIFRTFLRYRGGFQEVGDPQTPHIKTYGKLLAIKFPQLLATGPGGFVLAYV